MERNESVSEYKALVAYSKSIVGKRVHFKEFMNIINLLMILNDEHYFRNHFFIKLGMKYKSLPVYLASDT